MAARYAQQVALRDMLIARVQDTKTVAELASTDASMRNLLKVKFPVIKPLYEEFSELHRAIVIHLSAQRDSDLTEEEVKLKQFDNDYFLICSKHEELFPSMCASPVVTSTAASTPNVRLPKLSIPDFDGNLKLWPTFRDMFTSLIHNNSSLTDIERFQYLLASLKREPLTLAKTLPLTELNYQMVYNSILDRYNNTRNLANFHWREIQNLPALKEESPTGLRKMLDTILENLQALAGLGLPTDKWDFILVSLVMDKLDLSTRRQYELKSSTKDIPTWRTFIEFLENHCLALESLSLSSSKLPSSRATPVSSWVKPKQSLVSTSNPRNISSSSSPCVLCKGSHWLSRCKSFIAKSAHDRHAFAKQNHLCLNCLQAGHSLANCLSKYSCRVCQAKHNTLLHFEKRRSNSPPTVAPVAPVTNTLAAVNISANQTLTTHSSSQVLLATVSLFVRDNNGRPQLARGIIDPASQASYMTSRCANRLALPRTRRSVPISGIGQTTLTAGRSVITQLNSNKMSGPEISAEFFVLPQICGQIPSTPVSPVMIREIEPFKLADPLWHQPGNVDLLLGADLFPQIVKQILPKCVDSSLVVMETIFGYALLGPTSPNFSTPRIESLLCSISPSSELESTLRDFWQLEQVPVKSLEAPDDSKAENLFVSTVSRDFKGRFCLNLPFKDSPPSFSDSTSIADRRFLALEKRLSHQPEIARLYMDFMSEYLNFGHMSLLNSDMVPSDGYCIPHHCVLKQENGNTKIRVVFDASAKNANQLSLNDTQLVGPKLQNDIAVLLLRFRSHPVVLTCDVRQMYRQILVTPEHRKFQLIRFRFDKSSPIQTYQLNTVTYGVSSSPFLAIRTLLELAELGKTSHPLASEVIRRNLYVDDIICSVASIAEAQKLKRQLIDLFASACFELRKWSSNCPEVLDDLSLDHCQLQSRSFDSDSKSTLKILGLQWQPPSDCFSFQVSPNDSRCTKRSILSQIARIYDPLGFLSPVIFVAKRLIQLLWCAGIDWDAEPPISIQETWHRFTAELCLLASIEIPRFVFPQSCTSCEIHGFSDASVYFRCSNAMGDISTHFVIAKSKLAPLTRMTIPRLELLAAVLLSKLIHFVVTSFCVDFRSITAWTDSTVTLHWIRSFPHRWGTFIGHRVAYIQERVPPHNWQYVPSSHNAADVASRGLQPSEVVDNSLWWAGPSFLSLPKNAWPQQPSGLELNPNVNLEERKISLLVQTSTPIPLDLLKRHSSLRKVCGIVSYIRRFISYQMKRSSQFPPGICTSVERHHSLLFIVKMVQREVFADLIAMIVSKQPMPKWIAKLAPFLDNDGMLRVGGRLSHSSLPFASKHPALLPKSHRLCELLIRQIHEDHFHAGISTTLHLMQQNFWILSSRRAVRHYLSKCNRCFRAKPLNFQAIMGDLPALRVNQAKTFSVVGCDFAGPFNITMSRSRGVRTVKAYLCLFVCFATKAVHLELVSSLSSEAFIAALRRFVARRGRCTQIYSDCGTNFIGANRELIKFMQQATESDGIEWSFNPPSAPHFGGLWESGVKSVKHHLVRVVGQQSLTYEELNTVFVQIEAILNSRPLCALSSDPKDLNCLTPGHFLTLEPLTCVPDPDLTHLKTSRLTRWQLVQQLQQSFWTRWRNEYLHGLYQRSKWTHSKYLEQADVGALVLIKNELAPPLKWRLGRITMLHPGRDGTSRVATVRTTLGEVKRPLVKLCALPTQ